MAIVTKSVWITWVGLAVAQPAYSEALESPHDQALSRFIHASAVVDGAKALARAMLAQPENPSNEKSRAYREFFQAILSADPTNLAPYWVAALRHRFSISEANELVAIFGTPLGKKLLNLSGSFLSNPLRDPERLANDFLVQLSTDERTELERIQATEAWKKYSRLAFDKTYERELTGQMFRGLLGREPP